MSDHDLVPASSHQDASTKAAPQSVGEVNHQPVRTARRATGGPVQAKLVVGSTGDPLEQEADQVAAAVMRSFRDAASTTPKFPGSNHRQTAGDGELGSDAETPVRRVQRGALANAHIPDSFAPHGEAPVGRVHRSAIGQIGMAGGALDADTEQRIQRARGGGSALPADLSASMGNAMGADFSGVRVHADQQADQLSQRIQARAFTTGSDVFFRQGEYRPTDRGGQELLAHELTHVVQQGGATEVGPTRRSYDPNNSGETIRPIGPAPASSTSTSSPLVVRRLIDPEAFRSQTTLLFRQGKSGPVFDQITSLLNEYREVLAVPQIADGQKLHTLNRLYDLVVGWLNSEGAQKSSRYGHVYALYEDVDRELSTITETRNRKLNAHLTPAQLAEIENSADGLTGPDALPNPDLLDKHEAKVVLRPPARLQEVSADLTTTVGSPLVEDRVLTGTSLGRYNLGVPGFVIKIKFSSGWVHYFVGEMDVSVAGWNKVSPDRPLFATDDNGAVLDPTAADVKQGQIGDCYLEAAISSLVSAKPAFVKSMFVDYGSKVGVRLYDGDGTATTPFAPRNVVVEKSLAMVGGDRLYDQGALWVSMLEKAYAAARFTGRFSTDAAHAAQPTARMGDISGGFGLYALMHLTGQAARQYAAKSGSGKVFDNAELPWSTSQEQEWAREKDGDEDYNGLVAYKMLSPKSGGLRHQRGKMDTDQFFNWVKRQRETFNDVYKRAGLDPSAAADAYKGEVRLEDIKAVFDQGGTAYWPHFEAYLAKRFPGKRGTGRYTDAQTALWKRIKAALDAKRPVTTGIDLAVSRGGPTSTGHSGGEKKAKGLAQGHEYSILAVSPAEVDPPGVRKVLVRNPWGKYSRQYGAGGTNDDGSKKPKAEEVTGGNGESWLDLADLTKRFQTIDVG